MKRSDLKKLTRRELYSMAKAYDVSGRSKMAKEDLVEALSRVSAKKVMPEPKPPKRRMAKRRKKRSIKVTSRAAKPISAPSSTSTTVSRPPLPQEPPPAYVDRGPELPKEYGQDKLNAMVRDPNWIFVYWDLSGGSLSRIASEAGPGAWMLRVHNLGVHNHEDIPVLVEGGNWYLPVDADSEYQIDIGLLDMGGNFHIAASSRKVKTPRMGISDRVDEEWLIMEDEFRRLMDISGKLHDRFSGSHFISEIISRRRGGLIHSAGVSSFGGSRRR